MQAAHRLHDLTHGKGRPSVLPGLLLMALALVIGGLVFLAINDAFTSYPYLFLLPWILGLGLVMIAPSCILYYQGRFTFADPIVFATFSYFFPAFVVGGLLFAGGWSEPSFLALIQDTDSTLPLTLVVVALGFGGLALGYFLPIGARIGASLSRILPAADHKDDDFLVPGIVLLVLGVLNTIVAFTFGVFGYQQAREINTYDGLVYLTTLFWLQGSFLLWFVIFRRTEWKLVYVPALVLLILTSISKLIFAGNRGTILQLVSVVALAYILSGRRFRFKQMAVAGFVLLVGMMGGMIYGTTFRNVKGTEAQQAADQYAEHVVETFNQVSRRDKLETLQFGFASLAERVDIVSTLAVVVSNHEALKPYEEAYGLDNNIWVDMTTFFIPRIVWRDKPSASDPRKYSDLYFNFGETSFAITPMGDLLRNYGIIGVPIGMFVLGLVLRFVYRTFVEGQPPVVWRLTFYFMLLTAVSYEGFYGTIIPHLFKVSITVLVGSIIVNMIVKRLNPSRVNLRSRQELSA
jgi:MFS family permease